jgi:hypothetical protein
VSAQGYPTTGEIMEYARHGELLSWKARTFSWHRFIISVHTRRFSLSFLCVFLGHRQAESHLECVGRSLDVVQSILVKLPLGDLPIRQVYPTCTQHPQTSARSIRWQLLALWSRRSKSRVNVLGCLLLESMTFSKRFYLGDSYHLGPPSSSTFYFLGYLPWPSQ